MRSLAIALIAVLLSVPVEGVAQNPSFGLKGGLNVATFGGRRIVDADYSTGGSLGAFISIPISSTVTIQPEALFSRRRVSSTAYDYDEFPQDGAAPPIGVYISEGTNHDYLEIPLLVKLGPSPTGDGLRPFVVAGPSAGILLNATSSFIDDHEVTEDYEDYLNSTDFSFVIGGGVETGRLSLDIRYNLGTSSVAKDFNHPRGDVIAEDIKSRAFGLAIGLRLF